MSDDINKIAEQLAEKTKNTVDSSVKNAVQESELAIKGQITKAFDEKLQASQEEINKKIAEGIAKSEEKTELATKGMADLQAELVIIKKQNKQASFNSNGEGANGDLLMTNSFVSAFKENEDKGVITKSSELAIKGQTLGSVARGSGLYPSYVNPTEVKRYENLNVYDFFDKEVHNVINTKTPITLYSGNNFLVGSRGEGDDVTVKDSEILYNFLDVIPKEMNVRTVLTTTARDAIRLGTASDPINSFLMFARQKLSQYISSQVIYNGNSSIERGIISIVQELSNPTIPNLAINKTVSVDNAKITVEDLATAFLKLHPSHQSNVSLIIDQDLYIDLEMERDNVGQFTNEKKISTLGLKIAGAVIPVIITRKQGNLIAAKGMRYKIDNLTKYNVTDHPEVIPAMFASSDSYKIVESSQLFYSTGENNFTYESSGTIPYLWRTYVGGRVANPEGISVIQLKK